MKSEFWWYVARSGGIVAWALSAASVLWGLALSTGALGHRSDDAKLEDLHRFFAGLTVVFVGVHGAGLVLEDSLGLSGVDLVVPMAADAAAAGIAWGVVAMYLLVAVEVTSLLRERLSERVWRVTHYGGLAVFVFGTIHGLKVGTDVENPAIWWPAAIACAAVVGLAAYRILSSDERAAPAPTPAAAPRPASVTAALLERTLSELERLDTDAYPVAAPPVEAPPVEPPPREPTPTFAPATFDDEPVFPGVAPGVRIDRPDDVPRQPPVPSRAPAADTAARTLPTRVPQRLAATTAPAVSLGAWTPSAAPRQDRGAPPPPPDDAVDPDTGEPDPHAYRKWLRDWLEYVESQP